MPSIVTVHHIYNSDIKLPRVFHIHHVNNR